MKSKSFWYIGLLAVSFYAWLAFLLFRTENKSIMQAIHVACFAPWTLCVLKSIEAWLDKPPAAWFKWGMPVATAIILEAIQKWTPPHNPEWRGLTASLVGVVIGVLAYNALGEDE